ncbi:TIGR03620 family F420-dependent LLM class oxidoreductase [Frankia tisae]|uniref:TIGR03620 family F420-dependent LLM class oxidoreductase n=1 Tax=Frankia tisae TaxID=2950104 RepID=UPI0021BFCE88|nr:TIGR03620 family F420-dependent LLM class oxidoreductase [Frankia tisae]
MSTLGTIGIASSTIAFSTDTAAAVTAAAEVEGLGYATLWLPGGQGNNVTLVEQVVRGTDSLVVANGILSVDQVPAAEVAATYAALAADHPGRYLAGLGGAHGARPLDTLGAYLDALDAAQPAVPADGRILAALGPAMLRLARDRAAGAYPYLVTPQYVTDARAVLGPDRTLAVLVTVIPDRDPAAARGAARESIRFLTTVPGYARNLARMGFTTDDVADLSDRLVDQVTAWGDVEAIAKRVAEYLSAGADQVVLQVNDAIGGESESTWWRRLADVLLH